MHRINFNGCKIAKSDKPAKITTTHEGRRFKKAELLVKTILYCNLFHNPIDPSVHLVQLTLQLHTCTRESLSCTLEILTHSAKKKTKIGCKKNQKSMKLTFTGAKRSKRGKTKPIVSPFFVRQPQLTRTEYTARKNTRSDIVGFIFVFNIPCRVGPCGIN